MTNKEGCKAGNHSLVEIYKIYRGQDEVEVVRWCKECGSIVVDIDCDGRTYPGAIAKMKIPKSLSDQKARKEE